MRLPPLTPALRRDATLVAVGLVVGWLVGWGSHDSRRPASSKSQTLSPRQADRHIEQAKAALENRPEDLEALSNLAAAYYFKGPDSYVDGLNALEKARSLGATDERLFYYAGVMWDALGLHDYVAHEFGRYLRHHPKDYEALVQLANVLYRDKQYDEARTLYQRALNEYPKDPTVWFNLAMVSKEKGELDEAEHALRQVQRLSDRLPVGGNYLEGELARLRNNDDLAMRQYQAELETTPTFVPALEALEAAQKRKGLSKEAKETRKRLLEAKKTLSATAVVTKPLETPEVSSKPVSTISLPPPEAKPRVVEQPKKMIFTPPTVITPVAVSVSTAIPVPVVEPEASTPVPVQP